MLGYQERVFCVCDQPGDRAHVIGRDRGRAARLVPEREDRPNVLQSRGTDDDIGGARPLGQAGNGSRGGDASRPNADRVGRTVNSSPRKGPKRFMLVG
jgi:hypothetical protein